jgi:hypothetical protein
VNFPVTNIRASTKIVTEVDSRVAFATALVGFGGSNDWNNLILYMP